MESILKQEFNAIDLKLEQVREQIKILKSEEKSLIKQKNDLDKQITSHNEATLNALNKENWSRETFPWSEQVREVRSMFNIQSFRAWQLESINVVLSKRDLLLVMPTGGGKSLCYQLPGLVQKGFALVVSPLISLMEDQVLSLRDVGVLGRFMSAGTPKEEINQIYRDMTDASSDCKFIFVTPERISKSKRLISSLEKAHTSDRISLIVIDEVHCASQWGHDFRPDYKKLCIFKLQFPQVPVIGLTATATSRVLLDVQEMLRLSTPLVFRAHFNRDNLFYEVRRKLDKLEDQINDIYKLITAEFYSQSGIIYCLTKKDCESVTNSLLSLGLKVACYHADVPPTKRRVVHHEWLSGDIQIVISTIAFGLGINKKNVRFVIHHSLAKSLENYYQECGRAGRDGQKARCILFYRPQDYFSHSCMVLTEKTGIQKLHAMVSYCHDTKECRRSLVARHFDEKWDPTDCFGMCDNCLMVNNNSIMQSDNKLDLNVKDLYQNLIDIIAESKARNERLTLLKLAALCKKRKELAVGGLTSYECMCLIMHGLLNGILKEDYHFTAYNTISYILVGPMSIFGLGNGSELLANFYNLNERSDKYEMINELIRSKLAIKPEVEYGADLNTIETSSKCTINTNASEIALDIDIDSDSDIDIEFPSSKRRRCNDFSVICVDSDTN